MNRFQDHKDQADNGQENEDDAARHGQTLRHGTALVAVILGVGEADKNDPHTDAGQAGEDGVGPQYAEDQKQRGDDGNEHIESEMADFRLARSPPGFWDRAA